MTEPLPPLGATVGRHVAADRAIETDAFETDAPETDAPERAAAQTDAVQVDSVPTRTVSRRYGTTGMGASDFDDTEVFLPEVGDPEPGQPDFWQPVPRVRRPWPFGLIAVALTALLIVLQIVAISLTASGEFGAATVLAEILGFATVLPLVVGLLAIIRNQGRTWGIVAVAASLLTNPLVLVGVLGFFGSF